MITLFYGNIETCLNNDANCGTQKYQVHHNIDALFRHLYKTKQVIYHHTKAHALTLKMESVRINKAALEFVCYEWSLLPGLDSDVHAFFL